MSKIVETFRKASPYLYAGFVRAEAAEAVRVAREQLADQIPSAKAFLASSAGEAVIRLAAAGVLAASPKALGSRTFVRDMQQELLVGACSAGVVQVQTLILGAATAAYKQIAAAARGELPASATSEGDDQ